MNDPVNLVADIGGTNIRLARSDSSNTLIDIETYQCCDFSCLLDVIQCYLTEKKITAASINACLAIACPVDTDIISMTNLPWQFSQTELKKALKLNKLILINDYTAIAMAIPMLTDEQKVKIGGGKALSNKAIAVCGPGTGLGVANLLPIANKWYCFGGEGGHVDYAAIGDTEIKTLQYIQSVKPRVSYEQLLSGYGLEQIYQALLSIHHGDVLTKPTTQLTAKEISTKALDNTCSFCHQALDLFCKVLGSFAGNLALTMNTQGGVYIAGGIVPRFIDFLSESDFRLRFEAKGRMSSLNKEIATYVITEKQPGLLGASVYLNQVIA
ncbi:glucokinase [Colwellia sp. 12G3]|uniref:glucokinase n=1 Tax=Colwellia sp. 12G3 TaxID=2058299 RepID=UPI000C343335|nr:glucokinase [Colwellia sp. 12G3]PKI16487.1 glucokinase [Colwellia sp. 12G3]